MTTTQWIGVAMLACPFILLFAYIVSRDGLKIAVTVFGLTAAIAGFVVAGCYLMTGGK